MIHLTVLCACREAHAQARCRINVVQRRKPKELATLAVASTGATVFYSPTAVSALDWLLVVV